MIVKPCNLGSSAGVSVAGHAEELVAGVLKVFEYDVEALIEPFIRNRLELNVAVAGLDEPVASVTEMPVTSQDVAAVVQREVQAAGRQEHRLERRAWPARCGCSIPTDLPAETARARAALRDHRLRRARLRGHLAHRLSDRRRHRRRSTSTRSTRCPARWRSISGPRRRTTGRSPISSPGSSIAPSGSAP